MQQATLVQALPGRPGFWENPTLLLCLAGFVLPNALSIGALVAGIGAPPRTAAIMAYATVALVARLVPPVLAAILYILVAIYDAISTVALLFNLAPSEIGLALHLSADLKLFASPLYVGMIAGLGLLVVANIAFLIRKRDALRAGNPVVMIGLALAIAAADLVSNASAHYQFGTLYSAGKPMESAAEASGFRAQVLSGNSRNVLLVMVEALGEFALPARQALLLQPFRDSALRERYDVTAGSTTYYGSTTAAEMRELCNTREPYQSLLEGKKLVCLPEQMAERGYQTISLHNFTSAFFGRDSWYPKLGFEKRIFSQDLAPTLKRQCGGPFRGACDVDLVPLITQELHAASKPTFFYWMTLSTHVPIAPQEGTPRLGCEHGGRSIGHAEVCYMTEMWMDLFESLAKMTADIPPTEILIVGDHAPPLWSKAGRQLFTPGQATWIRLTPRAPRQAATSRP